MLYVKKMSSSESGAELAKFFPKSFSKLPVNFKYSEDVEEQSDNLNLDDLEEKINEIDLSLQVSPRKRKRSRSRSSFHSFSTRSSHSSRSSKTQNSELTSSSLFQTMGSFSNPNSNINSTNKSPIKIKISHIVKRKKKKNIKKSFKKIPIKNYMKNTPPPRTPKQQSNEQKCFIKNKLLPFSDLYPRYHIRFNYHPKDLIHTDKSPGCPIVLTYRNGDIETQFKNGTSQILHLNNKFTYFSNGDVQHEFPDGAIAYFYASNKAKEFNHPNGTKVLQFLNGERYTYHPNTGIEISYHKTKI